MTTNVHHLPKLVILDFDGTIGNSNKLITTTMRETLRELSLPEKSAEECSRTIGLRLEDCFRQLLDTDAATAELCAATYRQIFAQRKTTIPVEPFPHVAETLQLLHDRGVKLSLASSRFRASLKELMEQMHLQQFIDFVLGGDDCERAKPDPMPVTTTLRHFGLAPADALVVGDMTYDILMGRRAGCATCGVSYGNGSREELLEAGADRVVDDFADIVE
jgi:phosphoglycolate phosphatase